MRVETEGRKDESRDVLKPEGDIVASNIQVFRGRIRSFLRKGGQALVLDMSNVRMIDSVGLGVLISTHNALRKKGVKLTVTHVSGEMFDLFKAMRLDHHFEIKRGA